MKNPPEVKAGDKVRVVVEGKVDYTARGWFSVGGIDAIPLAPGVVSIEVLKQPVKVGDVIEGADAYEALPIGAVVHPAIGVNCAIFRTEGGFTDARGNHYGPRSFYTGRTVAYLPEVAA